jgi:hypothetical protein
MPTPFSPEEIENLKKAISNLEKEIRHEAKFFWLQLLLGLLIAVSAFYSFSRAEESAEAFDNFVQESFQESNAALIVDQILQIKVGFLRAEFTSSFYSLMLAVGAGVLLGGAIGRRSRRSQSHAQFLLLKHLLETHIEPANKALKKDTGDVSAS